MHHRVITATMHAAVFSIDQGVCQCPPGCSLGTCSGTAALGWCGWMSGGRTRLAGARTLTGSAGGGCGSEAGRSASTAAWAHSGAQTSCRRFCSASLCGTCGSSSRARKSRGTGWSRSRPSQRRSWSETGGRPCRPHPSQSTQSGER